MRANNPCFTPGSRTLARALASGMMIFVALLTATPAQAAFHLWTIREIYTDASGTNQFIELFCTASGQTVLNGQQIKVTTGGATNTFTISGNISSSTSKALLFGTASIQAFGSPAPDYIIANNFLFATGATITFFGQGGGAYPALPTDGVNSRAWVGGTIAVNSPQNFAGTVGSIVLNANSPPVVSITNPPNSSLFAAPGLVSVGVSATDDVSVASVRLLTNGVAAATNTVAPFGFTLSNLTAGYYTLRALAVDNQAASATSAPVTVRVAGRPVLAFAPGTSGPVQFQFNSVTGVSYVIERGSPLTNFSAVVTNAGANGVLQFAETNGVLSQGTYRVRVQ